MSYICVKFTIVITFNHSFLHTTILIPMIAVLVHHRLCLLDHIFFLMFIMILVQWVLCRLCQQVFILCVNLDGNLHFSSATFGISEYLVYQCIFLTLKNCSKQNKLIHKIFSALPFQAPGEKHTFDQFLPKHPNHLYHQRFHKKQDMVLSILVGYSK